MLTPNHRLPTANQRLVAANESNRRVAPWLRRPYTRSCQRCKVPAPSFALPIQQCMAIYHSAASWPAAKHISLALLARHVQIAFIHIRSLPSMEAKLLIQN